MDRTGSIKQLKRSEGFNFSTGAQEKNYMDVIHTHMGLTQDRDKDVFHA